MVEHMDPRDLKPGQWVDGFRIIRRIGSGYFGVVFEAEKAGHRFALKFACHREGSGDAARTDARMQRELCCLHLLRHPNIVRVWGSGRYPDPRTGWLYIVLDLIDGDTLEKWAERTHPTAHELVVLIDQSFAAIEHMHAHGVVHRDLNLRNILVKRSDNEPVIIDFSVGDYVTAENLTSEPLPPGTPRYRSPEAARFWEQHRHDPRARYPFKATDEIYALGAVLYDVLTCARPSEAHKGEPLDNPHVPPLSPFEVTQGRVPQALSDFIMSLIARSPEERPHARDSRRVLADLRQHQHPAWHTPFHPAAAQVPPAPVRGARRLAALGHGVSALRGMRGWPWSFLAGGLALMALVTTLGVVLLHAPEEGGAPVTSPAAKQTNLSGGLPSALPTQKEMTPTLSPPEKVAPLPAPPPPPARRTSAPRPLSLAEKCTLAIATITWLKLGCAGVQLRPEPGPCPEENIAGMKSLGYAPDDQAAVGAIVDVNQSPADDLDRTFAVYKDGPITGALFRAKHSTQRWDYSVPPGTRLEGHLWTSGDRIYGRYLWALVPGRGRIPVCLEIGDDQKVGMPKEEGSKPGAALGRKRWVLSPVLRWR